MSFYAGKDNSSYNVIHLTSNSNVSEAVLKSGPNANTILHSNFPYISAVYYEYLVGVSGGGATRIYTFSSTALTYLTNPDYMYAFLYNNVYTMVANPNLTNRTITTYGAWGAGTDPAYGTLVIIKYKNITPVNGSIIVTDKDINVGGISLLHNVSPIFINSSATPINVYDKVVFMKKYIHFLNYGIPIVDSSLEITNTSIKLTGISNTSTSFDIIDSSINYMNLVGSYEFSTLNSTISIINNTSLYQQFRWHFPAEVLGTDYVLYNVSMPYYISHPTSSVFDWNFNISVLGTIDNTGDAYCPSNSSGDVVRKEYVIQKWDYLPYSQAGGCQLYLHAIANYLSISASNPINIKALVFRQ